jgi:hypothetical protein
VSETLNPEQLLAVVRDAVVQQTYVSSFHAVEKAEERGLVAAEIEEALLAEDCEIIEDYLEDHRGPSCLILGWTRTRRPLHVQVSYPPEVTIVTVYEPDPAKWIDNRKRR